MASSSLEQKLTEAIAYRDADDFQAAQRVFEELIALAPDDGRVYYQYAWLHDKLGEERNAAPLYECAIALGLPNDDLRRALLGLGSTYRSLGKYDQAVERLRQGMAIFEDGHEFAVFLAMALYNVGDHAAAMELLLLALADTSADPHIQRYARAIRFYADKLDQTWP